MSLTRSRHYNRKQSRASRLDQFALLKCATPLKYLMRVHALGLSNSSHARSRQKSEFYYPPLLSNAPPYPSTRQSHQHIVNGQLNLSPEGKGVRLHMDAYLGEFCWRYNRRGEQPEMFDMALSNMGREPLPYAKLKGGDNPF